MTARRGFALVASVWLVVGITAVALEVSWLARTRRLQVANAADAVVARAAARSGLEHARARLVQALRPTADDALADPWRWPMDGGSALGAAQYTFTVRDEASTLNVNASDEATLARLFVACGADLPVAEQAAARLADWTDADQLRRTRGAERADYVAVGARAVPRDGAVPSVAELDDVLELPVAPWACVRPLLSTGGAARVNPNTAPVALLQALPGIDAVGASAIVAGRRGGRLRDFRELVAAVPPGHRAGMEQNAEWLQRQLVYRVDVVRVVSEASVAGSPVRIRAEALMRRTGSSVFTAWRVFR